LLQDTKRAPERYGHQIANSRKDQQIADAGDVSLAYNIV